MSGQANTPPEEGARSREREVRVLVIEDEQLFAQAVCKRLRKAGFTGVILGHTGNSVPEDLQYMCDMGADACDQYVEHQ